MAIRAPHPPQYEPVVLSAIESVDDVSTSSVATLCSSGRNDSGG